MHCPRQDLVLQVRTSRPLSGTDTVLPLEQGEQLWIVLGWHDLPPRDAGPAERIAGTVSVWRRWASQDGAIVAAATSSLPERIGGGRNWDHRYSWVRDAAFAVFALRRVGLSGEAERFLLRSAAPSAARCGTGSWR